MRADKVERIARFVPDQLIDGPEQADLLVLSWGGTRGVVSSAVSNCRARGLSVAHAHLRYLNPFPRNLGALLSCYSQVLAPELNGGQLALLLRARYAVETISFSKIQGRPFGVAEVEARIEEALA
jgi:2-oxoglutarate ferredoxin oxidoreductase subunit alpha